MTKLFPLTLCAALGLALVAQAEDKKCPKGGPQGKAGSESAAGQKPQGKGPQGKGPGGGPGNPEERMKMMAEKLGLSAEQKEKLHAVVEKNAPQMRELMGKGRENLTEDEKKKMMELMQAQKGEMDAILTPEQKAKFEEVRKERGPGGPGGPEGAKGGPKGGPKGAPKGAAGGGGGAAKGAAK